MLEKYGKPIDMSRLRSLKTETEDNLAAQERCRKYYVGGTEHQVKCRLCGNETTEKYFEGFLGFTYYQCKKCKGLFLGSLPRVKDMYTGEDSCNAAYYMDDATFEERVESIAKPKVDFVLEACAQNNIKVERWLDIGSGGGQLLSYVKSLGIEECGIESDANQYQYSLDKGLKVENIFIDPDEDNTAAEEMVASADVVSLITVLEHMEKPDGFINYLKKTMKHASVIVIEVPRHPSVSTFACMMYPQVVMRHMCLPGHLQIFHEKTLEIMLGSDFDIIAKWCFGQGFSDLLKFPIIQNRSSYDEDLYHMIMGLNDKVQAILDVGGYRMNC